MTSWRRALLLGGVGLTISGAPVAAQTGGSGNGSFDWGVAATLQSLTGILDPPSGVAGDDIGGIHGAVLRLKWSAEWGDAVRVEVHDRVLATLVTGGDPAAGFGVTRRPGRALDLTSRWVDEERIQLVHDLDRLSLTLRTDAVDVILGRQAISWGTSVLFPTADLWAALSPFELDVEERPGVDGLRAFAYPAGVEVDGVLVDRGPEGVSGGARATWSGARWEVWGGGGRFWDRTLGLLGVTWVGDRLKVRGEVAAGDATRATVGVDRVATTFSVSAEVHYNGLGADDPDAYDEVLASKALARGETYFLGSLYAGVAAAWSPDEENRLSLTLSALANLHDGSTVWSPSASYDLGRSARVAAGGVVGRGTEFGAYPRQVFVRIALFL